MLGSVPLARRNLFQERRRALLAVGGVGVALLLVLVLDGIFAGAMRQVTAYIDRSPADVFVSQAGVRTMHMSASALPAGTVDRARAVPGVAWAEGIRFTSAVLDADQGRQLSYVIGYDPGGHGGPGRLGTGRPPGLGQAVVDQVAADQLGIRIGGRVRVLGVLFTVSGFFRGGTSITNTTTFIRSSDFARLRGPATSYVLVGADPGVSAAELARRLQAALPGVTVQTKAAFTRSESRIVSDMSADLMRIMSMIGFTIALAVVALTLFTVTLAKLREYGVLKALGARPTRLAGMVASQAAWTVLVSLVVAVALALVVGAVLGRLAPTVDIAIVPRSVARTAIGAMIVGALGALVPLRRVLHVDPASAFRRPS